MKVKIIDMDRVDYITTPSAKFTLGKCYEVFYEDPGVYHIKSDNGYAQYIPKKWCEIVKEYIIF